MESYCPFIIIIYVHYPTIHPVLLYHGQDGQYYVIQVSIQVYCPSHPIVPWTGWTVL